MIATGRIALPKRVESLKRYVANFSVESLDGKFPAWSGGGGYIVADFQANPAGSPRSAFGPILIVDGATSPVLDVPNALIQVEEGPMDGVWHTIGNFVATGISTEQHAYSFRLGEQNPEDVTSLVVDFALTDVPGFSGFMEVARWTLGL